MMNLKSNLSAVFLILFAWISASSQVFKNSDLEISIRKKKRGIYGI